MKLKRLFFLILGCVCLALGCVGIVLPVLPTVPFFLATVFCFANSSEKLHTWFLGTELYPFGNYATILCLLYESSLWRYDKANERKIQPFEYKTFWRYLS